MGSLVFIVMDYNAISSKPQYVLQDDVELLRCNVSIIGFRRLLETQLACVVPSTSQKIRL